jgi:HlyD family secretion protein
VPRKLRRVVLFALLAAAAVAAAVYFTRTRPVEVVIWTVDRGRVEATVSNTRAGTIEACRRSRLAPQAGGQVASLPVREGDRVSTGHVLLELWNEDLEAELQLAMSEHLASEAKAKEACILAKHAEGEADRHKALHAEGITRDEALQQYIAEAEAKRAGCDAATALAEVSKAKVAVARAALERTILKAPFAGVVAEVDAELGEYVMPSPPGIPTPPAIDLIEEDCIYVRAPIDEVDAARVKVGLEARVTLDAYAGVTFEGSVKRVAPYVLDREKQARTVDVEVELARVGAEHRLLPGYSADVEVLLEAKDDVLRVPTECLLDGNRVLVLAGGVLRERKVTTGIANWRFTEILGGLEAGDRIVTSVDRDGVVDGARAVADDAGVARAES